MKIIVLGAGAWGTALAISAASGRGSHGHQVTLWARDAAQVDSLRQDGANARYLPGIALPDGLLLAGGQGSLPGALSGQDLIIIATPVSAVRGMLQSLQHARV